MNIPEETVKSGDADALKASLDAKSAAPHSTTLWFCVGGLSKMETSRFRTPGFNKLGVWQLAIATASLQIHHKPS